MENSPYLKQFKRCGSNVRIHPSAYIEHPECIEVGDNVTIHAGFHLFGKLKSASIGSGVTFYPNCTFNKSCGHLRIDDHVEFYAGNFIEVGASETSSIEIGHHSHFAPYGVLYGWGGLKIGAYCNIAAHVVMATVGHHDEIVDQPMALTGEKSGPITLGEDIWVAANVTLCANTTIARGCIIAANSVLTQDATEPMSVYAGVPARFLRPRG